MEPGVGYGCCGACIFFFQADAGIRDKLVTGVQTCALPISKPEAACREVQPSASALSSSGSESFSLIAQRTICGRPGSLQHTLRRLAERMIPARGIR